jgi:hypothetical protein
MQIPRIVYVLKNIYINNSREIIMHKLERLGDRIEIVRCSQRICHRADLTHHPSENEQ